MHSILVFSPRPNTAALPHLATSYRIAGLPSIRYDGAIDYLKSIETIQENAFIASVFVPSELVTYST
jgi:hypothetical protein